MAGSTTATCANFKEPRGVTDHQGLLPLVKSATKCTVNEPTNDTKSRKKKSAKRTNQRAPRLAYTRCADTAEQRSKAKLRTAKPDGPRHNAKYDITRESKTKKGEKKAAK